MSARGSFVEQVHMGNEEGRSALKGAILGALLGATTAVACRRWRRRRRLGGAEPIHIAQVVPLATSVLNVLRQLVELLLA